MTDREKQVNENMQKIAEYVNDNLPEGMGFVVLAFEFGTNANENRLMYVSNANRDDVVDAMDEFKEKTKQDFGKHKDVEDKTWYDADELLKLIHLPDDTSIWCLNKHNYSDYVTTLGALRVVVSMHDSTYVRHFQFAIIGKGEDNAK